VNTVLASRLRRRNLLLVIAAVLVIKAVIIFWLIPGLMQTLAPHYGLNSFADLYDRVAQNLADGNGYRFSPDTAPSIMREPGYPVFLSMLFRIFGYGLVPAQCANLLLSLLVVWGMVRILSRLSQSHSVWLGGSLLFLFHPATVIVESRGGFELLFMALLVWFMVAFLRALENNRSVSYFIAGAVLGGAVLVKSTPILFPMALLPYLLIVERSRATPYKTVRNLALLVIAMVLVLSPWIIRNYRVSGKFIPTASVLGISAHSGQYICKHHAGQGGFHNADTSGGAERQDLAREMGYEFKWGYYQLFYSTADEIQFSQQLLDRVIDEYRRSPSLFLKCTVSNLYNFWFAGRTENTTRMNLVVQIPYLILAIAGLWVWMRRGGARTVGPIVLFIPYYMGVHLPILAQARYTVSLLPFLAILGAGVIAFWTNRRRERQAQL
jgi:4-amino-4-deoxy-L-arabinose transferase-like glycosyltransferase